MALGDLISPVEPFDHLLERTEFLRNSIVVGKPGHLYDAESEFFAKFTEELLCSKRICAVAVSDKTEVFGKLFPVTESHAHGRDAGSDATVIRHLIADNGTLGGISSRVNCAQNTMIILTISKTG